MKILRACQYAIALASLAVSAQATTITTVVPGTAMPWHWGAGLNTTLHYGILDGSGPVIVDSSSGISFGAGEILSIRYLSGLTSAFGGSPTVDGNGYGPLAPSPFVFEASGGGGSTSTFFPSLYMSPYPIYLNALVGAFTNASGEVVGTPFAVNDSVDVVIPVGATRLQLGLNDDLYADNTGSLSVSVSSVPEPGTFVFATFGLAAVVVRSRVRR
jgi:hypothetical protein